MIGCDNKLQVIEGMRCSECGKIVCSDTTAETGTYKASMGKNYETIWTFTTSTGKVYILGEKKQTKILKYFEMICDSCRKGKWAEREREKNRNENKKAAELAKKAVETRMEYGREMQISVAKAWPGMIVRVHGPENRYFTWYYKGIWVDLMTDNFVAFLDKGSFWQDKRDRGFTRCYFKSIYGYYKCVYLED